MTLTGDEQVVWLQIPVDDGLHPAFLKSPTYTCIRSGILQNYRDALLSAVQEELLVSMLHAMLMS